MSLTQIIFRVPIILIVVSVFSVAGLSLQANNKPVNVPPVRLSIPIPADCQMVVGDSRVLEVLFYSGDDNLNSPGFKVVTERNITWKSSNPKIATVDPYGRLDTKATGTVTITVASNDVKNLSYSIKIDVVKKATVDSNYRKMIVNYKGRAIAPSEYYQKIIKRYNASGNNLNNKIPKNIKNIIYSSNRIMNSVIQGQVSWKIVKFADGSNRYYVLRTDYSLSHNNRDRVEYMMGDEYIPGTGVDPIMIIGDKKGTGIWVVGKDFNVTHIIMRHMTLQEKAFRMERTTAKYVDRMGLSSGSRLIDGKWVPQISDNDGLWTGMYGTGELMRWAVLSREHASVKKIATARKSAFRALKAVLMLSWVSGRDGTVAAKIRHLYDVRNYSEKYPYNGNKYSEEYLKNGATYAIDNYNGSPYDYIGFRGLEAGKTISVDGKAKDLGGYERFTLMPFKPKDWITEGIAAATERTLNGFIARSFAVPTEQLPSGDGLFFQRNKDGSQTVLSGADNLYYPAGSHPVLNNLGNDQLPKVLRDVPTLNGKTYSYDQLIYKGDTSTDEIIGHLLIYKTGFDVLDQYATTTEGHQLKALIVKTVTRYAQHLIDNDYQLVDATGEGTTWGKTTRDYFNSDFTIEDNSLNSLVVLDTFKMAYYMTGEKKWQDEYLMLATKEPYMYAYEDSCYWKHWMWLDKNEDYDPSGNLYKLPPDASAVEMRRHAFYTLNHADEEMAIFAYYLIFQMEQNPKLLTIYREGLNGWWHSISYGEHPLWYYMYQIAYPNKHIKDPFGRNILKSSAWALSRDLIDTREYIAYVEGSRSDVLNINGVSVNPKKVIGHRKSKSDIKNASKNIANFKVDPKFNPENIYKIKISPPDERTIHNVTYRTLGNIGLSNSDYMEPATTYTTAYWFGRYHYMLKADHVKNKKII